MKDYVVKFRIEGAMNIPAKDVPTAVMLAADLLKEDGPVEGTLYFDLDTELLAAEPKS